MGRNYMVIDFDLMWGILIVLKFDYGIKFFGDNEFFVNKGFVWDNNLEE